MYFINIVIIRNQKNIFRTNFAGILSEGVVKILVEQYDLRPITAPEQDMDAILGR